MSSASDWLLELGHTRLKVAPLAGPRPGPVEAMAAERFGNWLAELKPDPSSRFWLAAVPEPGAVRALTDCLDAAGLAWRRVHKESGLLPVAPAYDSLGVDRWLALQPPWLEQRRALCVVDCGSALTIDLVDGRGRHHGGWIAPGPDACRDALFRRAPVLRGDAVPPPHTLAPACSTGEGIARGLLLLQAGAIEQALEQAARLPEFGRRPHCVLTGGAGESLAAVLASVQLWPDLVLDGLALAVERIKASR
ncbi:MAG: type III pantothenate kinase [Wenzhouxiangellaceae bacterium]|nr:type III pantothenate kinase [Wenzhouxiangellaceae bacterium]